MKSTLQSLIIVASDVGFVCSLWELFCVIVQKNQVEIPVSNFQKVGLVHKTKAKNNIIVVQAFFLQGIFKACVGAKRRAHLCNFSEIAQAKKPVSHGFAGILKASKWGRP